MSSIAQDVGTFVTVVTIGLDTAKLVFQEQGEEEHGKGVLRRRLCQRFSRFG